MDTQHAHCDVRPPKCLGRKPWQWAAKKIKLSSFVPLGYGNLKSDLGRKRNLRRINDREISPTLNPGKKPVEASRRDGIAWVFE
jgi:hypothetical protein